MSNYHKVANLVSCGGVRVFDPEVPGCYTVPLVGGRAGLAGLLAQLDRRPAPASSISSRRDKARAARGYLSWYRKLKHLREVNELSVRYGLRFHRGGAHSHQWEVSRISPD